jgi:hypothetical protein
LKTLAIVTASRVVRCFRLLASVLDPLLDLFEVPSRQFADFDRLNQDAAALEAIKMANTDLQYPGQIFVGNQFRFG